MQVKYLLKYTNFILSNNEIILILLLSLDSSTLKEYLDNKEISIESEFNSIYLINSVYI